MIAHRIVPPAVSGYVLSPTKRGAFKFVKAEATENLLSNPSFEHPFGAFAIPTGYTTTAAALITQSLAYQRRISHSVSVSSCGGLPSTEHRKRIVLSSSNRLRE